MSFSPLHSPSLPSSLTYQGETRGGNRKRREEERKKKCELYVGRRKRRGKEGSEGRREKGQSKRNEGKAFEGMKKGEGAGRGLGAPDLPTGTVTKARVREGRKGGGKVEWRTGGEKKREKIWKCIIKPAIELQKSVVEVVM